MHDEYEGEDAKDEDADREKGVGKGEGRGLTDQFAIHQPVRTGRRKPLPMEY